MNISEPAFTSKHYAVHDSSCPEAAHARDLAWSDKWLALPAYLEGAGLALGANTLRSRVVEMLDEIGRLDQAPPGQDQAFQDCKQNLNQLLYIIEYPEMPPLQKSRVLTALMSGIGHSRDMAHIATCLGDAVYELSSFQGGWDGHQAVWRHNTVKTFARAAAGALITNPDPLAAGAPLAAIVAAQGAVIGRIAQREHLNGPLANEIVNLLADEYGLRKNNQPATFHTTDAKNLARVQEVVDGVRRATNQVFEDPSILAADLADDAQRAFFWHMLSRKGPDGVFPWDDPQQRAEIASKISQQICGQENALKPESFALTDRIAEPYDRSHYDNSALERDFLAHMRAMGELR
ncbi:hypothetical protein [Bordetella sp. N]|uniref:hypothetical protein n=1 Tax=Bordetella sp. N TaxID=1746199 RepID=UPI000709B6DB|nr:hypothetical protein [Bordetella sp. N]ALM85028.1 hypothetical protein ASB57_20455 [Bordetella sp. N]